MSRSRFAPDRQLTTRMVAVVFLLGLLYVTVAAFVIYAGVSAVVVVIVAALFLGAQWFFSDRIALAGLRARVVEPEQAPELHAMIDRLCVLADMPKPRVAVADTDMPNAFATGRTPNHAVVCVTTGIMRRLEREELEGVLAHELSHVAHRDVAVMTVASFLGVLAGLVARYGMYLRFGRSDNRGLALFLAIWAASVVVYAVSFVLTRALSRYRELSADRTGAILTGQPSTLASALTKITGEMAQIPDRDLREVAAFNAFLFAPAAVGQTLMSLLSTHPPLERRLDQLAKISAQMGRS